MNWEVIENSVAMVTIAAIAWLAGHGVSGAIAKMSSSTKKTDEN